MTESSKNQDQAKVLFLEWLIADGYNAGIRIWTSLLKNEPVEGQSSPTEVALHTWFSQLGAEGQKKIFEIIEGVARSTLFHSLVVMDQGFYVQDKRHELVLYLNTYESEGSVIPKESFRICPDVEDLHDLFTDILDEMKKHQE